MMENIATKTFWKIQSNVCPVFFFFYGMCVVHKVRLGTLLRTHWLGSFRMMNEVATHSFSSILHGLPEYS